MRMIFGVVLAGALAGMMPRAAGADTIRTAVDDSTGEWGCSVTGVAVCSSTGSTAEEVNIGRHGNVVLGGFAEWSSNARYPFAIFPETAISSLERVTRRSADLAGSRATSDSNKPTSAPMNDGSPVEESEMKTFAWDLPAGLPIPVGGWYARMFPTCIFASDPQSDSQLSSLRDSTGARDLTAALVSGDSFSLDRSRTFRFFLLPRSIFFPRVKRPT
jgi:hypothetical protein